ncbi:MAG: hypothetical protein IJZ32_01930 [Clostridia bacterium]|nr:hypothetical protein [Clostridia bacterium]
MKKKISVLVSALAALSIFATACDSKHTHTFSEDWESDATNHWHAATCEHGEEKSALARHKDEDEDGKCDVCAYEVGHTHTYAEDWSKDDTHHWHAATCTHTDEVADKGLHEDVEADGTCDVCGGHAHVINKAGACDVCDEQVKPMDETNLEMVIAATALRYKNIATSTITNNYSSTIKSVVDDTVADGENPYGYTNSQTTTVYTLGENATMVVSSTENQTKDKDITGTIYDIETESNFTKWMWYDANDSETPYKGIWEETINVDAADEKTNVAPISVEADDLHGYYYAVSTLADAYGAENILAALYEMSQNVTASDFTVTPAIDQNRYMFTFNNLIIHETNTSVGVVTNANLFETTVAFEYSDTYELKTLYIYTDCYTNDAGQNSEADVTLEEVDGEWVKKENATPSTYEITTVQTVGERTYTHTKTIDEYLPTTFTFKNGSETVVNNATLNYERGDDLEIDIVCNGYFDLIRKEVKATLTSASGNLAASIQFRDEGTPFVVSYGLPEGTYTLTVMNGNDTLLTATVEVEAPQVQGSSISVTFTDNNAWVDLASLTATESGTYTFTIPAGYGAFDKDDCDSDSWSVTPYVDPNMQPNGGTFSVDIAAGDTYQFYVMGPTKNETVQIPYTFVAGDVSGGGDVGGDGDSGTVSTYKDANGLGGTYTFSYVMTYTLVFTTESEGATSGTLTVTAPIYSQYSGTYSYTIEDGAYVFTSQNAIISKSLDGQSWQFQNPGMRQAQTFAEVNAGGDSGTVSATPLTLGNNGINAADVTYAYTAETDGTLTLTAGNAIQGAVEISYTVNGGNSTSLELGNSATLTLSAGDEVVITVVAAGYSNLTAAWEADGAQGGSGDQGTTSGDGSESNPFVIESFPADVTAEEDSTNFTFYTFTSTDEGILTITYANTNAWWFIDNVYDTSDTNQGSSDQTFTVEIQANSTYVLKLGVWDAESAPLAVTLSFTAQALAKDGDFSKPINISTYSENSGSYTGGEDNYVWFSYNPWIDGTLTLTFAENVNVKYGTDQNNLTATVSNQSTVAMEISSYEKIYIAIQAADYEATTITFTATAAEALGTSGNPIVIEDYTQAQNCEFKGGVAEVWYLITTTESGYVTLSSTFATAKLQGGADMYSLACNDATTYGSVRFYANAGEPTYVVIGDWAEGEAATIPFTLSFVAGEHEPDGSYEYPYIIENVPYSGTCDFAGGYSYVWYEVTVSETGYLTVTSTSDVADLVISPVTSAYHDNAKTGSESVEYGTNAGVVYVGVKTSDNTAAEIAFSISFEAGELEADGSSALPFTAVVGNNTCAFPGGMNPVWYSITTTEACTITVSSSYVSDTHNSTYHPTETCAWLIISPEADAYANGAVVNSYLDGVGTPVSIEAEANTTYYIAVADYCEAEADIVFNVTFTPAA